MAMLLLKSPLRGTSGQSSSETREVAVERFPSRVGASDAQRPVDEGPCCASLNAVSSSEAHQRTVEQRQEELLSAPIQMSHRVGISAAVPKQHATFATRSGKCHWASRQGHADLGSGLREIAGLGLAAPQRWARAVAVAIWAH